MLTNPTNLGYLRDIMRANGWTPADVGERVGVSARSVQMWLDGTTKTIRAKPAAKLREIMNRHYRPSYVPDDPAPSVADFAVSTADLVSTPVIGLAAAAGYQPPVHNGQPDLLDELADGDRVDWRPLPPHRILIRVEGRSMEPDAPEGSILEVDTSRWAKSAEMVVALFAPLETPVVKYYQRKDNKIQFRSRNRDLGHDYDIDLKAPGDYHIWWIYPVLDIQRPSPKAPAYLFDD